MRASTEEAPITARISGRPTLRPAKIRQVRARDLAVRFVAGALTSVAAGVVTLGFGARAGGILLAFPAILAASLTLIERQEDRAEAREDARGAVWGGFALAAFAAVAALTLGTLSGALALVVAGVVWVIVAVLGYMLAWYRRE
jgi:small-conductance mechanosensitive channel